MGAIEIFAGSGRLSACLKQRGFDAFGIDHVVAKGAKCTVLRRDLCQKADRAHLWELIAGDSVRYIHMAPPCGTSSRKAFWLKVPNLGRGGLARLACWYIDSNAMARLAYLLLAVLLVLGDVPMMMATRRKPKRRPVVSDDGGDCGAADPGPAASSSSAGAANPAAASQRAGYRYCNDTVYAAGDSAAAGSGSLPVSGPGHSGGHTPLPGSQTIVELTWQTAYARLTLQTDSPAMVEAAEWSAAVSQDPPPAQQDRSMAAVVTAYGDAVLCNLIEGIMQAMSRRGISEHRQRNMVATLMFSLAHPLRRFVWLLRVLAVTLSARHYGLSLHV